MMRTRRSRNVDLEFETQTHSGSSFSSYSSYCSRSLPKGSLRPPPELSTGNDLIRIAPLTSEVVARMCITKAEVVEGAA